MTAQRKAETAHLGVDVTDLVGTARDGEQRSFFDHYKACFNLATTKPSVEHFRQCVDAYDDFIALFHEDIDP